MASTTRQFLSLGILAFVAILGAVSFFYFKNPVLTHVYPQIVSTTDIRTLGFLPTPTSFGVRGDGLATKDGVTYARFDVGGENRGQAEALIALPTSDQPEEITEPVWVAEIPDVRVSKPCELGETIRCQDQSFDLATGERTATDELDYERPTSGYVAITSEQFDDIPGMTSTGALVWDGKIIDGPSFANPDRVMGKTVKISSFLRTRTIVIISDGQVTRAIEGGKELWNMESPSSLLSQKEEPQFTVVGDTVVVGRVATVEGRDPITGEVVWTFDFPGHKAIYDTDQVMLTDRGRAVLLEFGESAEGDPTQIAEYDEQLDIPNLGAMTLTIPPMCGVGETEITFSEGLDGDDRLIQPSDVNLAYIDGKNYYLTSMSCDKGPDTESVVAMYTLDLDLVGYFSTANLDYTDARFYQPLALGTDISVLVGMPSLDTMLTVHLVWDGSRFTERVEPQ